MKAHHRYFVRTAAGLAGLLAGHAPALAEAARAAAPMANPAGATARAALPVHGYFLAILTVLFVVVFAITIASMARQRKSSGDRQSRFAGPTGTVQWLWAMVPFAILLFVDYVLVRIHFAG